MAVLAGALVGTAVPGEAQEAGLPPVDAEPFELPWIEGPMPAPVPIEAGSFAGANACKLWRSDRNSSLSFPWYLETTGTLRAAVLFADFPDAEAQVSINDALMEQLFAFTVDYFDTVSQGRMQVELKPLKTWLRASGSHLDYSIGRNNGSVSRVDYITEIAALADPVFDFSDVDTIWIVRSPGAGRSTSRAASWPVRSLDGNEISHNVTLNVFSDSVMNHEALHNLGLPDLYDTTAENYGSDNYIGPFDPMSASEYQNELLAWQRWLLGWIDDDQIRCVQGFPSADVVEPLGGPGGLKAVVVKLDQHRVLVIENRQRVGYDDNLIGYDDNLDALRRTGLLVYIVDGRVSGGSGPIKAQGTSTNPYVENYPDASILLEPGESMLAGGYVIEAVSGPGGLEAHILEPCVQTAATIDMNVNGGDGTGTQGDDVILGTPGDDVINSLGGNDVICSGGGDDVINAGDGDDVVRSGPGDDEVRGSTGDDIINSGQGNDRVFGKQGNDEIQAGPGDDVVHGNKGNDVLNGGSGNDRIFGYAGDDTISGGPGDDRIHGNFGDDDIEGGDGNDRIWGYGDDDRIDAGLGNDLVVGNFGNDYLVGGEGNDIIWGGDGRDTLIDGPLYPGAPADDDQLHGNSGNDDLFADVGNDDLDGGIGNDWCNGGPGIDTATRCEILEGIP